jgi:simple sugar transport system ATP-binding protein
MESPHRPVVDALDDLTVRRVVFEEPGDDSAEPAAGAVMPPWTEDDVLRVEHVGKRFGGVAALRDVNLRLGRNEALGVLGDNGSGKSTLIKILSGLHRPDAGGLTVAGSPAEFNSVDDARALGIECVYQDLALVDQMPVWQNVFLRRELVRRPLPLLAHRRMRAETRRVLAELGVQLASVDLPVGRLSGGERQVVALARSVMSEARILLLDEPTAALGVKQRVLILDVIARLRELREVSIILVGHNHAEVLASCERVNVLEDGRIALDKPASEVRLDDLVQPRRSSAALERQAHPEPHEHAAGEALHPPQPRALDERAARARDEPREPGVPDEVQDDDRRRHRERVRQHGGAVGDELREQRDEEDRELRVGEAG